MITIEPAQIEVAGHRIQLAIDRPKSAQTEELPVIVMPPAFNKTMRDYFLLSLYFVYNDFLVVRYDNVNHLGRSSGSIYDFNLSDCLFTLEQVTAFVRDRFQSRVSVLATSLMGRVMLRHLRSPLAGIYELVGLLLPVVNVEHTINHIVGIDLFERERAGDPVIEVDILGNRVRAERFVRDVIQQQYDSVTSVMDDLRHADRDLLVFAAPKDEWVRYDEVLSLFSRYERTQQMVVLENSSHQLDRNLVACKQLFREVVGSYMRAIDVKKRDPRFPSFREIVENSRIDRAHEEADSLTVAGV